MTITIICQDTLGPGHTHKSLNEEKTHIRHLERTKPLDVSSAGGAFHVSRFTFRVPQAVRRLDRNHDGEVDFQEFYAWYEQEMTEAKMRDRPLYAEVKEMFNGARNEKRTETSILTMTLSHQFYEPTIMIAKTGSGRA